MPNSGLSSGNGWVQSENEKKNGKCDYLGNHACIIKTMYPSTIKRCRECALKCYMLDNG